MFLAEFVDGVWINIAVDFMLQIEFGFSRRLQGTSKIIFRVFFYDLILQIPKRNSSTLPTQQHDDVMLTRKT